VNQVSDADQSPSPPQRPGAAGWRRWVPPLYPLAIPVAMVVLVWSSAQVHPAALVRPLLLTLALGLAITIGLGLLTRDRDRGALVAALVLAALYAPDDRLMLVLLIAAGVVLVDRLVRRERSLFGARATRIATAIAVVAALATGLKLVQDDTIGRSVAEIAADGMPRTVGVADPASPDVYLIVLDAYPGSRAAAMADGFDWEAFPRALEGRGFQVARDSHSNYTFTAQTMASMLSMQHLADLPSLDPPWSGNASDGRRLRGAMGEGAALDAFAADGYRLVAIPSGFDHADLHRVDRRIDPGGPTELEVAILRLLPIGDLVEAVAPDLISALHRGRLDASIRELEGIAAARDDRPRFVYAHLPFPHAPWVFGPDGEPRTVGLASFYSDDPTDLGVDRATAFARASDQATYVAGEVVGLVDRILATSRRDPVILVMSDHGTGVGLDPDDAAASDLEERFSNFLAVRTPGHPDVLRDGLTPVNLLARVLDAYAGAAIPETDDGTYAWRSGLLDTYPVAPVAEWAP
jgi:hypothetical protein